MPSDMPDYDEYHRLKECARVTRLLCNVCRFLEEAGMMKPDRTGSMDAELCAWWDNHKHEDAARIEEEKRKADEARKQGKHEAHMASVRERLTHQLTDEEKEAIGFRDGGQ